MSPPVRKAALVAHVTSSVGWLGAVAAFLVLAAASLASPDPQTVRSADIAMSLTAWFAVVPLCFASFATGVVSSLGTRWGLFRHYWILIKLAMTIPATLVLLLHLKPIERLATAAARPTSILSSPDLIGVRNLLVSAAALALLVLLVATVLSIYKPRGMTAYGWRKQQA